MSSFLARAWTVARPLFPAEAGYPQERATTADWGWFPSLALWAGVCIALAATGTQANRWSAAWASPLFYAAIGLLVLPISARLVWPTPSRLERIALLLLAALGLFLIRMLHEPTAFVDHDAFLHWATANDIMRSGHLFTPNPLLPISSVYPAIEIVTTALTEISGLPLFVSAQLLLIVIRMLFVAALFLVYERASGSQRVAALAAAVYMCVPSFVYFDTTYSYGSLAIFFLAIALLIDGRVEQTESWRPVWIIALPILAALAVTHHLTAFITALLLAAFAVVEIASRKSPRSLLRILALPAVAIVSAGGWSMWTGNPTENYLGPVFDQAVAEAARFLSFGGGRLPFVAEDGSTAPVWQRAIAIISVVLMSAALATGFFRALAAGGVPVLWQRFPGKWREFLRWDNNRLVVLTLLTLGYPVSILLRLTHAGWEVGNRIAPFAFLGAGVVVAIALITFWQGWSQSRLRAGIIGTAIALCVSAGVFSGSGAFILGSPVYRVAADSDSVEPMAISAATWTRQWLGTRNRFFSDRVNRLLLSAYGGQQVITNLYDRVDLGEVLFAEKVGPAEIDAIRQTSASYFLIDMRLTQQLPPMGFYFDPGPVYRKPPLPRVLTKFNGLPGVSRVFDNGFMSIINIAALRDATDAQ
ncbi:hypothetical protein [Hyphomicrobium sp.]|uniref:hypothetical protein n=1 Tax=Hyphomicrobium sp. TaxID=82 RepID=UPI002D780ED4|nr:hypothetical protein [Hyphomicrobium sp.]HET6391056.1 hypothetical protein [Hyphomicrobium sp.]